MSELEANQIRIKVIGVGGAGSNTVHRLIEANVSDIRAIAVNTDLQHLSYIKAHEKLLLGPTVTRNHGTGGNPELGRMAAEESEEDLRRLLEDTDSSSSRQG